jgi:hypothetical protein
MEMEPVIPVTGVQSYWGGMGRALSHGSKDSVVMNITQEEKPEANVIVREGTANDARISVKSIQHAYRTKEICGEIPIVRRRRSVTGGTS